MVLAAAAAACLTDTYLVEPNCKNPPKNKFKKICEIVWRVLCLQHFDVKMMWSSFLYRKQKYWTLVRKIREITLNIMRWIYFWWVLAVWNHCVPWCCAECIEYSHRLLALQSSYMRAYNFFFSICRNKNVVMLCSNESQVY